MKKLRAIAIVAILIFPIFFVTLPKTRAIPELSPFIPHEVRVLVVSPADVYYSGAHYLEADLARYGFSITQQASDDAIAINYLNDSKTSNLNQYDVVIVHGILGFSSAKVSAEEVAHFTDYRGILILIGNALMQNETGDARWDFSSAPMQRIDQRLGVNFTGLLGEGGAWHNPGTFTLISNSIPGLPQSLSYTTEQFGSICYQMDLTTNGASDVYDYTITSSPSSPLDGKTTRGITFYRAGDGAVGIYIQGAYIYGSGSGTQISYFGITNTQSRSSLLASLIASALNKDVSTIVKPQPLANIRLDSVGEYLDPTYLNTSLANFNSYLSANSITPTIGFIDYLPFTPPIDYWKIVAPSVLAQLEGRYRDWEYSTNLRYYPLPDTRAMTQTQVADLIDNIKGNFSRLGMDLFSTVIAPQGRWNQSTLDAMVSRDLYLLDILDDYYTDWWNLRVNSTVIVHGGVQVLPETGENFTQTNLDPDSINYKYFSRRDQWALAVVNGFPSFIYYAPNFRWNEVGTYSLRTVFENLTNEVPDIRFVPLIEAGLYFGNKWMYIENASRAGPVIEFDIDASQIPSVVNIGKGMLWLRIDANDTIQEVSINNNRWSYFDEHSIRMPTPESSVHVRVTLGSLPSPRVVASHYRVIVADYDGYKLNVTIVSARALNVTVDLFLPEAGPFSQDGWNVLSYERKWSDNFNPQSRIFTFWSISDGRITFKVGAFWLIQHTPPWYNSSVTVNADFSALEMTTSEAILSYNVSGRWINITMARQGEFYIATIPAMRYGTAVYYRLFVYINGSTWLVTEISTYRVGDDTLPDIEGLQWSPDSPLISQPVKVSVPVSEPKNASGVSKVDLIYYLGSEIGQSKVIEMKDIDGTWTAEIPGQSGGAVVSFHVTAYDNAGNKNSTSLLSYTVLWTPIPIPLLALIIGIIIAVGIGAAFYVLRLRKTRVKTETDHQPLEGDRKAREISDSSKKG